MGVETDGMTDEPAAGVIFERVQRLNCAQCGTRMDVSALEPFAVAQCPDCGNQDTVPARFGEFLLLNLINTGGMGGVYRARDESLGRLVAIKVMLAKLGADTEFVENFKREAQAAARLNHPNVAQIYSYGQTQGQPFIVMELVSGHRFDRLIENHPQGLEPALVLRIGIDIADGLQAADEIGLIHGDIKPENILLDEKRKAKLVDFGIASYVDQAASEGIWGSPYYIAPEKARGRKSDARSDIFSLGATLYHALAGRPPFDGETPIDVVKARLDQDPEPLGTLRPELPKALVDCVARMLQREPAQRHPTYASLIGDLRRCLQEVSAASPASRVAGTGKRVMIKKKEAPGGGASRKLQPGSVTERRAQRLGLPSLPSVEARMEVERLQRRKGRLNGLIVAVVVVLVAAGVVLGLVRHQKETQRIEQRRQALILATAIESAAAEFGALERGAASVARAIAQFDPLLVRAREALALLDTLMPVDAPAVAAPDAAPVDAVPAESPPAAPPSGNMDEAGREAPFGMPARPAPRTAPAVPVSVPAASRPAGADDPLAPIRAQLRGVEELARTARSAGERAESILRRGELLRDGILKATSLEGVARPQRELREQQADMDRQERLVGEWLVEARTALDAVDGRVRAVRQQIEEERRVAEQRRLEAERQAREAAERAAVVDLARRSAEAARAWKFRDALTEATRVRDGLEFPDSRGAAEILVDRYTRLSGLQTFLVQELGRQPFSWGWGHAGGAREDILGANDKGVRLRAREVPWNQVGIVQYLAIAEHCIGRPTVRRSQQGEHYLALAIFCDEFGGDEAARRYRDRAVNLYPPLDAVADRLLP